MPGVVPYFEGGLLHAVTSIIIILRNSQEVISSHQLAGTPCGYLARTISRSACKLFFFLLFFLLLLSLLIITLLSLILLISITSLMSPFFIIIEKWQQLPESHSPNSVGGGKFGKRDKTTSSHCWHRQKGGERWGKPHLKHNILYAVRTEH